MLGNVIIEMQSGASTWVRKGWKSVLESVGFVCHELWADKNQSVNDLFNSVGDVKLFLGTTFNLNRPLIQQIKSRPNMKVALYCSGFGPACEIDLKKYPIQICN